MEPRRKAPRTHRTTFLLLLVTAVCAGAAECGKIDPNPSSSPTATPENSRNTHPPDRSEIARPLPPNEPVVIAIPAIHVRSSLIPLGLNHDGTVEVPPIHQAMQAGWYRLGPTAGELGPFVVLGHVDSRDEPGVFFRLDELRPGDVVHVRRADDLGVDYTVARIQRVDKDRFPTDAVYGNTTGSEIRLITCGGRFDRTTGSYENNVVVYGHMSGYRPAPEKP